MPRRSPHVAATLTVALATLWRVQPCLGRALGRRSARLMLNASARTFCHKRHADGGHDMATSTRRLVPQSALGRAQLSCLRVSRPWQPPSRSTVHLSTSPSTTSDKVAPSHCQLRERPGSCNLSTGGSGSVKERSACAVASAHSSHVRRGKSRRTDLLCAQWSTTARGALRTLCNGRNGRTRRSFGSATSRHDACRPARAMGAIGGGV